MQLLQSLDRGTNQLQLRIHSSYALYSPFVDRPESRRSRLLAPKNSNSGDTSFSSSVSSSAFPVAKNRSCDMRNIVDTNCVVPTILEMAHIKRGAAKSRLAIVDHISVGGDDGEEIKEGRIREKLLHAECLQAARELGLAHGVATLRSFSKFGGMQNFSKALVRSMSACAGSHETRQVIFAEKLKPFCERFNISFDESLIDCVKDLCSGTNASISTIQESASVAQCCSSVSMKCQGILVVLRTALFKKYSPQWLAALSRDAVELSAHDLGLKSELVEAARLLLIDGIVRKYCGDEGSDLFRVDNPRHANPF
mmetsp:Transcript_14378/g.25749  ORF Transcript_14378/g.25749 Transcript_14378/m.25749 type:complete len:311 (-) Transcript_14378:1581-2513(-)